ncbi:unnamed protein product [Adineta ricciae]|uniref:F-box domain-containing protein n=1 Tax=Adineta ricciae TaxID=249248 RepID=A0A815QV82_ADIRI|nr:unnamed protein product [Adineta ricciae]CAF1468224.1 unnamed protein product [Adineta ricciae]
MSLELLSNELLLYVFAFLDDVHLFRAFYGLNYRFNSLFFSSSRQYHLDFRSISKNTASNIFTQYLSVIPDRIISIHFSNDDETPDAIEYFLHRTIPLSVFSNLRSLSFHHILSYKTIEEVLEELRLVPNLTCLRFKKCYMTISEKQQQEILDSIWQLPKIIRCHIGISFSTKTSFKEPTVTSSSLKHLTIRSVNVHCAALAELIKKTPDLEYLSIEINEHFIGHNLQYQFESLISLKLYARDASFGMGTLLKCTPNLRHLVIESKDTYIGNINNWLWNRLNVDPGQYTRLTFPFSINGCQWEKIIISHLPKLKTFQLKIKHQCWTHSIKDNEVDTLLQSFNTPFWITERQWFVRCEWVMDQFSPYFCLYTLPYSFERYDILHPEIRSKSTCPNETDYWSYNNVRQLQYYCGSLNPCSMIDRIQFRNICYLSLELPTHNMLNSALLTLDHLQTLNVFTRDNNVEIRKQLQILFDCAPCLNALKITCGNLDALESLLLSTFSLSIRRLDVQEYIDNEHEYYFNSQQCATLCKSSFGKQCTMLRINVEDPMDVVDLVYSMPNLCALNVQIANDTYRISETKPSVEEDEVLIFLREFLDLTSAVTRNERDSNEIQLWIR